MDILAVSYAARASPNLTLPYSNFNKHNIPSKAIKQLKLNKNNHH